MFSFTEEVDFTGFTFIFPSVGVGNVAQLTVDLLIESLQLNKVATIWNSAIIPIIGPPAFRRDQTTTTSCELYIDTAKRLAVLQLRTPLSAKKLDKFFEEMGTFLVSRKFQDVIILTSGFAYERRDCVLPDAFEIIANDKFKESHTEKLTTLKQRDEGDLIPGGGFAVQFYKLLTEKQLSVAVLFKYVSEGDNIPDAVDLALVLDKIIDVIPAKANSTQKAVNYPISWKLLFGNGPPQHIY